MYVEVDEASEKVGDGGRDDGRLKERLKELLREGWSSSGIGAAWAWWDWWGSESECGVVA